MWEGVARDAPLLPAEKPRYLMGVGTPEDIVDAHAKNHLGFPAGMYASMYHDLARGKRLELESLSGLVVREGKKLGIPTPFHSMAYACLKPYANPRPGER